MLSLQNVSVYFGADPLFSDISFQVNPKERIALAGRNGAGKSTLLNIIAGRRSPTSGTVAAPGDMTIGYLPQHLLTQDSATVREEALSAFGQETDLQEKIDTLSHELEKRTDYDSDAYMELVQRLSNYVERMAMSPLEQRMGEVERTLKGLGFEQSDLDRGTAEFSGGWRMRIELAKILLKRPDLLLLDEPTNHLDMESIVWLENFLKSSSAAVIMVSHDRRFLDETTTRTIELSLGKAHDYKTNYSHYLQLREERYEQQLRAFENQQKMIKETEDFIERFRYKATKAVQVQSRIKALERIERLEVEDLDRRRIHFRFPMETPSGNYPVIVEDLTVSYGDNLVLDGIDLTIKRGEKIALVGKNGSGKTTFVRSVMGEIPYSGTIREGHRVVINYFAQNQASLLDPDKSIFQTIDDVAVGEIRTRINDILGAFMFGGEISEKKVAVLSGGERSRLAMIRLLLSPSNFLILDEPTNHLDIPSKEVLKEAIRNYDGTVLIVSHDRAFLEGLVDKAIEFSNHKIITHLGGIPEYLERLEERSHLLDQPTPSPNASQESSMKEDYTRQKEIQKERRTLQRRVDELESTIADKEDAKQKVEYRIAKEQTLDDDFEMYGKLTTELELLMKEWEEALVRLESFS